ncbi:hypothetical protein JB92DRAFT_2913955 [Gautieria morchelliformis]|nr:hypothetical protein JB92DRAFT_3028390 [Gautieria morchelliformis]KAF8515651.1 hypothetical protein JB92DRAFT_2913955 [Gautieria morchelliformis]
MLPVHIGHSLDHHFRVGPHAGGMGTSLRVQRVESRRRSHVTCSILAHGESPKPMAYGSTALFQASTPSFISH